MLIENPDTFKAWLTSILEPLCDADPAALAKYVYALVKKEKPPEELRDGMVDQLDVFLQHETKPFVDMLFKSLETQEYLTAVIEPPPESNAGTGFAATAEDKEQDQDAPPPPPAAPTMTSMPVAPPPPPPLPQPPAEGAPGGARPRVVVPRSPRVTRPAGPVTGHIAPPTRPPNMEQTLFKVLPLNELLNEPDDQLLPRRRERRGDLMRDKEERRRRRSRSWERRARSRRHKDGEHNVDRRHECRVVGRSPSPRRYRNRSPPGSDRPLSRERSRSPVPAREHERDRARQPRELERDRMSRDRDHRDRLSHSRDRDRSRDRSRERSLSPLPDKHGEGYKRRCRDFDEKGYCMRGDLCQWDHGTDPVVLEDAALTRVLTIPPPVPEYNPLAPDIWCGAFPPHAPFPPQPPHHPPHHPPLVPHGAGVGGHLLHGVNNRELVTLTRVRHEPLGPVTGGPRHSGPKNFDYNRLGKHHHNPGVRPPLPQGGALCSLEVKKVPRGLNDITHLNNHFGKFGKIVNIQVCFENDPEGALITFSSPAEANVAYKSTEAVLNNRFIKVFWHNPENKQENKAEPAPPTRPELQHPASHHRMLINADNMRDTKQHQIAKQAKENAALAANANTNSNGVEIKKEVTKPTPPPVEKSKQVMEMHKRAQALLETQLQQQVLLIQRLESGNVTGAQKAALMEAINSAQEGIEKLRKELVAYNKTLRNMQNAKKPKTREAAQKEILDAELDMFNKQQEGQDVTELLKKIAELRRQMSAEFPTPHPAVRRSHARGGRFTSSRFTRGGATGRVFVNQSVDHRPRALLVSGFEADELDALVEHFSQFGSITGKEVNLSVPELVLQYAARAHAELAALRGRHYNDRTLSITWVTNTKPLSVVAPAAVATPNGEADQDKETDTPPVVSEDALLHDEEDEEDEDRTWRR